MRADPHEADPPFNSRDAPALQSRTIGFGAGGSAGWPRCCQQVRLFFSVSGEAGSFINPASPALFVCLSFGECV